MDWVYAHDVQWWLWLSPFLFIYAWEAIASWRVGRQLGQSMYRFIYKFIWRGVITLLVLFALRGPSVSQGLEEVKVRSKDIFFCIDASRSMDAIDIRPSRLERLKLELRAVITALRGNRMGLIIFSSEAFVQCPLTYDVSALVLFLDALRTELVPGGGTDFGTALDLAAKKLAPATAEHRRPTAQAVVLISDGEDFGEDTSEAIDQLEEEGIKRFALGIGTTTGGTIPEGRGLKRDRAGKHVRTQLKNESLKEFAQKYFEINEKINQEGQLVAALKEMKGTVQENRTQVNEQNVYQYILGVAVILFVLDLLLPIRRFNL